VAKNTIKFFEDNNIELLYHPPYSPDLNPIEHVWGYLKSETYKYDFTNIDELKKFILNMWYEIDEIFIDNCINHLVKIIPLI